MESHSTPKTTNSFQTGGVKSNTSSLFYADMRQSSSLDEKAMME